MPRADTDPMMPQPCVVRSVSRETPDTLTLELQPASSTSPGQAEFQPGQFSKLWVFGVGELPLSISGDPGDARSLTYTVRSVGPATRALTSRQQGQALGVRGPFCTGWPLDSAKGPPWGEFAAINVNTGDVVWKVPLGMVDELAAQGITNTGTPNVGGPITTSAGLVFIGATRDKRFRAFDARSGKELWVTKLDAAAAATPITYRGKNGKQYVVVASGGPSDAGRGTEFEGSFPQKLVAFSLP